MNNAFASPFSGARPLEGRTALVTGAGRGIGRGVAEELSAAGAYVVAADIDAGNAKETVGGLSGPGEAAYVDVSDEASVDELFTALTASGKRVDLLANVAGVLTISNVIDLSVSDWDRIMNVNARGVFLVSKAALPGMIEAGGGDIVSIASAAGKEGVATAAHYCASKFAVVGFTQSLAKEVAEYGIRVNAVCPGVVQTQMIADVVAAWKTTAEAMVTDHQLIKHPQDAREIGAAIVFLATMPSITGQSINVEGGCVFH